MGAFRMIERQKQLLPVVIALLAAFLLMCVPLSATADEPAAPQNTVMEFTLNSTTYTVNGAKAAMDVGPAIIEGRTLLPIRYAAEPLGAAVGWDEATRKATVSLGATELELWIGQSGALINGQSVAIDPGNANVKPLILAGRTMLPLRFVGESLGCDVGWDPVAKKVTVTGIDTTGEPGVKPDVKPIPEVKIPDIILPPQIIPPVKIDPITPVPDTGGKGDILNINDTAYYENYFGTLLTLDTDNLATPDHAYQWGVMNDREMSLQYFAFYLKPDGKYDKFRASFFLDQSAKADLVMNIHKDSRQGPVMKSLTLKPGKTIQSVTVDISGVDKLYIESELRINHGTVKKLVVGNPLFYNGDQFSLKPPLLKIP